MRAFLVSSVATLALTLPAAAQDRSLNFTLGAGAVAAPEYFGSDEYDVGAVPSFSFGALNWGRLNFGNGARAVPDNGLSARGAFRIIGDRKAEDHAELAGLEDIDTAVELGIALQYQETNWMAFGEVRKGVTGHSGVTGTIGADFILRPGDKWLFTAGSRMNFGNDEFADTYFSTPGGTASGFDAYQADGGLLSAGFQVSGSYFISDRWSVDGVVSYEKLLGDAGDSPITQNGSEDQWRIGLGLSRVFTLNF